MAEVKLLAKLATAADNPYINVQLIDIVLKVLSANGYFIPRAFATGRPFQ